MGGGPVAAIGRFAELATTRVDDGVVAADWAAGWTMQRIQLGIEPSACPTRDFVMPTEVGHNDRWPATSERAKGTEAADVHLVRTGSFRLLSKRAALR